MLVDDNGQQQASALFLRTRGDLRNILISRDEYSEIIANTTKTLHMNTPEQTMLSVDINAFNDNNEHHQQLIEQLQAQLKYNQMRRTRARDYGRILQQSNTPAYWYKAPPTNRSVYFYDPNYQKYVHQRTISPQRIKSTIRTIPHQSSRIQEHILNQSNDSQNNPFPYTPRTKYILDLYNTTVNYHQQKQRWNANFHPTSPNISQQRFSTSSQLQSRPTLPRINTSKQRNDQKYDLLKTNGKNHQPILTESRKKINQSVTLPTSE